MLALTNRPSSKNGDVHVEEGTEIREIRALTPPPNRRRRGEAWETGSRRSTASSGGEAESGEHVSREFHTLVISGERDAAAERIGEAAESGGGGSVREVERVMKEAVEAKIAAWENAKVARVNNRFKREDAVINGWENEQVLKSTSWMNKVERRLEEKRVRAMEKMQNEIAKAHGKAEERRVTAEARRGSKMTEVLQFANQMRAAETPPAKRSF